LTDSDANNWPQLSAASDFNIRRFEKTFGILWAMVKSHDAVAPDSTLKSATFFSTSEYAQIPLCVTKLFAPLVQQVFQAWTDTFHATEKRLAMKVSVT
jgi:hypothetical protein